MDNFDTIYKIWFEYKFCLKGTFKPPILKDFVNLINLAIVKRIYLSRGITSDKIIKNNFHNDIHSGIKLSEYREGQSFKTYLKELKELIGKKIPDSLTYLILVGKIYNTKDNISYIEFIHYMAEYYSLLGFDFVEESKSIMNKMKVEGEEVCYVDYASFEYLYNFYNYFRNIKYFKSLDSLEYKPKQGMQYSNLIMQEELEKNA